LQIDITYDSSVSSAPAGFETAVQAAVQYLDSAFNSPITINIDVGWGEVDGTPLDAGAVGESNSIGDYYSYSAFRSALLANAVAPNAVIAAKNLPTTNPTGGGEIYIASAEEKALGLESPTDSDTDGWVGLDSSTNFTFDPNNRAVSGEVDAIGVLEHEMTEVLGRISILGQQQDGGTDVFGPLDLFRYTNPGTLAPASNVGFFSIDGQNFLNQFDNPTNGGDSGDWTIDNHGDSFDAFVDTGQVEPVTATDVTVMEAIGYQPAPVATDFTGVGMSDILWQQSGGSVAIWTMNGTNPTAINVVGDAGSSWHIIDTGAFFGGVDADLLWQNDNGSVAIWEMNGSNVVATAVVGNNPGPTWHVVSTGDFSGTGQSDILWQNNDGTVAIWDMNGFNVTSETIITSPGSDWHIVGTGDFNGDGKSDILWQDNDGSVAIWEMNGSTKAAVSIIGNPGPSWHVVGTGDFNGDGFLGIVWQNTDGTVAIWEMNGLNVTSTAIIGNNPGPAWHIAGVGDYNGDGKSDILFQNANGQAAIWEMNDFTVVSTSLVGANPGTTWQIQGDGAAAYQIGSGFTVPLSGSSAPSQGTGVAAVAAPSSLSQMGGHFANNGLAMPHSITVPR
jgi:hypothetical protein